MEQQNHELLGLIVARQRAICEDLLAKEKKQEDRITRRAAAFNDTCLPQIWESVVDIVVPHYLDDMRELSIPVRRYGRYIRSNDMIVGIAVKRHGGGEATWKCKLTKDGQIKYVGDLVMIATSLECNVALTKQQFEQTFIDHVARIIPVEKLEHIQPVEMSAKKGRRRVVALAD